MYLSSDIPETTITIAATNAQIFLSWHNQSEIACFFGLCNMLVPNQTINETRASAIESRPSALNIKLLCGCYNFCYSYTWQCPDREPCCFNKPDALLHQAAQSIANYWQLLWSLLR